MSQNISNLSPVYLYILMRTDLGSLNPGKACAQAGHAANAAIYEATAKLKAILAEDNGEERLQSLSPNDIGTLLYTWENQTTQGFGTSIVLGVKEAQMRRAVAMAQELGLHANITHDPTYPLPDGETLHLIPLDTCAYILARKEDAQIAVQGLDLMP